MQALRHATAVTSNQAHTGHTSAWMIMRLRLRDTTEGRADSTERCAVLLPVKQVVDIMVAAAILLDWL